jgi:hypothetical protein
MGATSQDFWIGKLGEDRRISRFIHGCSMLPQRDGNVTLLKVLLLILETITYVVLHALREFSNVIEVFVLHNITRSADIRPKSQM